MKSEGPESNADRPLAVAGAPVILSDPSGDTVPQQNQTVNTSEDAAGGQNTEAGADAAGEAPAAAREGLPQKAKDYLTRAENKLPGEFGTALSVPTEKINSMRREFCGENKGENNARKRMAYEERNRDNKKLQKGPLQNVSFAAAYFFDRKRTCSGGSKRRSNNHPRPGRAHSGRSWLLYRMI
jgi:hypothetical protein